MPDCRFVVSAAQKRPGRPGFPEATASVAERRRAAGKMQRREVFVVNR
ncbi:Uncharacterized protein PPKH_3564 [Pseudomonas putida]|nr:Uncharacterized protein PPKH_3564 [Pseudomonas putida]